MNYPLISEYIEAIKAAKDNFAELVNLRAVLGEDGQPVMTSGNFAVVFKMKDEEGGRLYAVKCFTKEQEGRAEAYKQIAEHLTDVDSPYFVSLRYLEKELFVDTEQTCETEFPVLLMDWVEGKTLDKYLRENLDDKYALEMLAYRFSQLAQWMIPQPFAHGDLKPDNILVREDGSLVLVDYDGMYVPAMKGQKARELGSPDFRHPLRTENDFDEHIDDFPLISILLSLKAIALKPQLLEEHGTQDRLLLSENDYREISQSEILDVLKALIQDAELAVIVSLLIIALSQNNLSKISVSLINVSKPIEPQNEKAFLSTKVTDEDLANAWTDEYGVKYSGDKKRLLQAHKNMAMREYTIKDGTVVICDWAFYCFFDDLSELVSIKIPNSVTRIGKFAFANCNLKSLFIPNSVTFIADNAFANCCELVRILVENDNRIYDSRNNCNAIIQTLDNKLILGCSETIIPNNIALIGDGAFVNCSGMTSLTIPNGVTSIGKSAFFGCFNLTSVTIPSSVTTIGDSAFMLCRGLKEISFANVEHIGMKAFFLCTNLQTVVLPNKGVSMGQEAFSGCRNLNAVYILDEYPIYEANTFKGCPNIDFIFPNSGVI